MTLCRGEYQAIFYTPIAGEVEAPPALFPIGLEPGLVPDSKPLT